MCTQTAQSHSRRPCAAPPLESPSARCPAADTSGAETLNPQRSLNFHSSSVYPTEIKHFNPHPSSPCCSCLHARKQLTNPWRQLRQTRHMQRTQHENLAVARFGSWSTSDANSQFVRIGRFRAKASVYSSFTRFQICRGRKAPFSCRTNK
jgi:hypothetical protein